MNKLRGYTDLTVIAFVAFIILVIGCVIWWHLNYKCTESHYEWRQECTVHRDSKGKRTGESCHDRRVDVCDNWEER